MNKESFSVVDQPIIVIGMHRSGTTLVAQILSELGVDMGRIKDVNHEPRAYIAMNNWILRQAGTTWEYVLSIERLTNSPDAFHAATHSIKVASSRLMIRLVHATRYSPFKKGQWGWKDPRNTATLPVWLEAFPNARIVYVRRHGVPVASSLAVRRKRFEEMNFRIWHKLLTPIKPGPAMGSRLWTMQGCLEMWSEYQTLGEVALKELPDTTEKIVIEYEDLLTNAKDTVQAIAEFVSPDISDSQKSNAGALVRQSAPYSFREKEELAQFEIDNADLLKQHGYEPGKAY